MKFTPDIECDHARLRPLTPQDVHALKAFYAHCDLPGSMAAKSDEQILRMVDLSVKMAATQRGMMWLLVSSDADDEHILAMLSAYDWNPSQLRLTLRLDATPKLDSQTASQALLSCVRVLSERYHIRNVAYQWVSGQSSYIKEALENAGFIFAARLRDAWRLSEHTFANIEQFHLVLSDHE